jgi:hypothetical protein
LEDTDDDPARAGWMDVTDLVLNIEVRPGLPAMPTEIFDLYRAVYAATTLRDLFGATAALSLRIRSDPNPEPIWLHSHDWNLILMDWFRPWGPPPEDVVTPPRLFGIPLRVDDRQPIRLTG